MATWTNITESSASWTPATKNSANYTPVSKNSASYTAVTKNSASWTAASETDGITVSNTTGATGVGFGDTGNDRDYLAQGFVATSNNVTAVAFWLDSTGTKGMKVWIDDADANSNPQGAVGVGIGGATEIANGSLVSGALTKYTLDSPVIGLTVGNRYCLVMAPWNTSTHVWAEDYRDIKTSTANPYTSGRRVHLDENFANPTAPDSGNADIQFAIYGGPAWTNINES